MTERFQIIHLGNPYDFVVKDHQTNKTYGTLQGDDKSLMELLNELHEENQSLKNKLEFFYELNKPYGTIIEENKRLKSFIKSLASPDGRIWLDNGYGYRISKILEDDVE